MSGAIYELIFILVLILLNGVLAMAETAYVTARKARLQYQADAGDQSAHEALELAGNLSKLLSTTQIGITLIGILAGAFGGATLASELADRLAQFDVLRPYSHAIALGLVVLVVTYLSLVLGELVPKRLALNNPERIASALARPMNWLAQLTAPLVQLLTFSTDLVLKVLGTRPSDEPPITEDEIRVLLEQGTEAGVFEEAEQDMVEGVFRLADRRVGAMMTPRHEIIWLDLEDPIESTRQTIIDSIHSRLPVAVGNLDQVVGIVQAKDLLGQALTDERIDLQAALFPPQYVPESMETLKVLEIFRESGVHIALVIDEFGGLQGLVTLQDIIEGIVGDLPAADEVNDPEIIQRADGSWLMDGSLPVDEFKEILNISDLPLEDHGVFHTLGGFIMTYLGRVPQTSDYFEWSGLHFEVVDMDGFRVDKVLVKPASL